MDEPDAFDRACEFDSTGHPDLAVPLYREALEQGPRAREQAAP